MCPACSSSIVVVAGSVTMVGGFGAIVMRFFRPTWNIFRHVAVLFTKEK
jgi:hypothetical protein